MWPPDGPPRVRVHGLAEQPDGGVVLSSAASEVQVRPAAGWDPVGLAGSFCGPLIGVSDPYGRAVRNERDGLLGMLDALDATADPVERADLATSIVGAAARYENINEQRYPPLWAGSRGSNQLLTAPRPIGRR